MFIITRLCMFQRFEAIIKIYMDVILDLQIFIIQLFMIPTLFHIEEGIKR